ncbi:MAG: hypothetical protein ACK4NY_22735 [Spirosomataceae bacterium]
MKTKLILTFTFIALSHCTTFCQKSFDIILGGGAYFTPIYAPVISSGFFAGEFEYHHNSKWSFASGLITSQYYFKNNDGYLTVKNIPVSRGTELQSNFLVKYKLIDHKKIAFQVGLGAGLVTYGREVKIENQNGLGYYYIHQSNTDLGFPISFELYRRITKRIFVGAKYGTFIFPDYPIIGNNIGLQTRVRI